MLRRDTLTLTVLLGLLTAFGPMATDIYVPSMPSIGRLFGVGTAQVQLTLSSYLVGYALGQVVYGPIADRFGRKPALLLALALFCAASFACAIAPGIETLIVARCGQALGAAGVVLLPRAIVRDLHAGDAAGRELSRMGAIMSLVPVIAPLIGGLVQTTLGWRATFVVVVGVGIGAGAVVWRSLPETLQQRAAGPVRLVETLRHCRVLLRDAAFLAHSGILGCSYAVVFAWISGSPFVLQNLYGLSPVAIQHRLCDRLRRRAGGRQHRGVAGDADRPRSDHGARHAVPRGRRAFNDGLPRARIAAGASLVLSMVSATPATCWRRRRRSPAR